MRTRESPRFSTTLMTSSMVWKSISKLTLLRCLLKCHLSEQWIKLTTWSLVLWIKMMLQSYASWMTRTTWIRSKRSLMAKTGHLCLSRKQMIWRSSVMLQMACSLHKTTLKKSLLPLIKRCLGLTSINLHIRMLTLVLTSMEENSPCPIKSLTPQLYLAIGHKLKLAMPKSLFNSKLVSYFKNRRPWMSLF